MRRRFKFFAKTGGGQNLPPPVRVLKKAYIHHAWNLTSGSVDAESEAGIVAFFPQNGETPQEALCGYSIIVMAVYWMTEAIPIQVTALLPVVLFPITGEPQSLPPPRTLS